MKLLFLPALLLAGCMLSVGQVIIPNAGFEQPDSSAGTRSLHWKTGGSDTMDNVREEIAANIFFN
jgi:hypothetical protein